jgi:hypothetical protein
LCAIHAPAARASNQTNKKKRGGQLGCCHSLMLTILQHHSLIHKWISAFAPNFNIYHAALSLIASSNELTSVCRTE